MKIRMNENAKPVYEDDEEDIAPPPAPVHHENDNIVPPQGTLGRVFYDHKDEIDAKAQRSLKDAKAYVREIVDQEIGIQNLDHSQQVILGRLMQNNSYLRFTQHYWNIILSIQGLGVI